MSWAANGTGNSQDNIINGSDNSNNLNGAAGDDTINGGYGNDTIDGGTGIDRMSGGLDDDTYTVDDAGDLVIEGASQGTDTVRTGLAYVLGANLENLVLTGAAAVNGTGNTLHNAMTGNSGANSLSGGTGDDTLNGNGGTDTLVGGAGNDLLIVDDGTDIITEIAAGGLDTVQSAISFSLATNVNLENLTLTGSAANGTGNAANNVIVGNGSNNVLLGDDGNEPITGGGGTDSINGEDGNDTLSGVGSLSTLLAGSATIPTSSMATIRSSMWAASTPSTATSTTRWLLNSRISCFSAAPSSAMATRSTTTSTATTTATI